MKSTREKINIPWEKTSDLYSTTKYIFAWAKKSNYPIPFTMYCVEGSWIILICIIVAAIINLSSLFLTIPIVLIICTLQVFDHNKVFNVWINEEKYENLPDIAKKTISEFIDSQKSKKIYK